MRSSCLNLHFGATLRSSLLKGQTGNKTKVGNIRRAFPTEVTLMRRLILRSSKENTWGWVGRARSGEGLTQLPGGGLKEGRELSATGGSVLSEG